ncbi:MAG: hypothetical protein J6S96_09370 [Muribaculaceae bacterium]|nr:hypothetical protein [Muribaculaceae bacterium]
MPRRLLTYVLLMAILLPMQAKQKDSKEQFHGIDVSWYQKKINWDVTAQDKRITFAFIKATEGGRIQDANYRYNIENARRKGIKVGSYHFLRPETPAKQQFENFVARVKKNEQDLIPVIDIEDVPEMGVLWKPQQAKDFLKEMLDLVEKHFGCKPMIYTSNKFFTDYLGRAFANYPLFIARYGNVEPEPLNGTSWTLWQFTKSGRVDGIDHVVDLSRFNKGRSLASIAFPKAKPKGEPKSHKDKKKHHKDAKHEQKHKGSAKHKGAKKGDSKKDTAGDNHNKKDKKSVKKKISSETRKDNAAKGKSKKDKIVKDESPAKKSKKQSLNRAKKREQKKKNK